MRRSACATSWRSSSRRIRVRVEVEGSWTSASTRRSLRRSQRDRLRDGGQVHVRLPALRKHPQVFEWLRPSADHGSTRPTPATARDARGAVVHGQPRVGGGDPRRPRPRAKLLALDNVFQRALDGHQGLKTQSALSAAIGASKSGEERRNTSRPGVQEQETSPPVQAPRLAQAPEREIAGGKRLRVREGPSRPSTVAQGTRQRTTGGASQGAATRSGAGICARPSRPARGSTSGPRVAADLLHDVRASEGAQP